MASRERERPVFSLGEIMKRFLLVLLLTQLPGCVGFEDYYGEPGTLVAPPASCGCQSPPVTSAAPAPSTVPMVSQSPGGATTREPELNVPRP